MSYTDMLGDEDHVKWFFSNSAVVSKPSAMALKFLRSRKIFSVVIIWKIFRLVLSAIYWRFHEAKNSIGYWIFPVRFRSVVCAEQPTLHPICTVQRQRRSL